jgi:hypothetical protein
MGCGMVLGIGVGQVLGTRAPVHEEVTMFDAVANPIKTHMDSLELSLANEGIDNSSGN